MIVRNLFKKMGTNDRCDHFAKEIRDLQRAYKVQSSKINQIMKENETLKSQGNSRNSYKCTLTNP